MVDEKEIKQKEKQEVKEELNEKVEAKETKVVEKPKEEIKQEVKEKDKKEEKKKVKEQKKQLKSKSLTEEQKAKYNSIIQYPISTEKVMRLMQSENKLIFVVDNKATKKQIKEAIENLFDTKVEKVNINIIKGKKRAYVKFNIETPALDVATKLGIL